MLVSKLCQCYDQLRIILTKCLICTLDFGYLLHLKYNNTAWLIMCIVKLLFKLVLFSTTDINECTEGTAQCTQQCNNTVGSFQCSCYEGYSLNGDNLTCTIGKSIIKILIYVLLIDNVLSILLS